MSNWRSRLFAFVAFAIALNVPALAFQARPDPNLPDPNLTAGSVRPDGRDCKNICGQKEHPRPSLPHGLRDKILTSYGLPPGTHPDYEIDHLIPRCLGGSDDPSNLWPEPRRTIEPKWNAEAKDRLEHLVCEMVCDKQLDLATEQKAIAKDWIAEYHKRWEAH